MVLTVTKKARAQLEPEGSARVGSVRTFLDELERLSPERDFVYYFRGHTNFTYKLVPSIYRDPGWIENEDILFKELILRCPADFSDSLSTFQTLVKMQHYSLPTRLLDITANPLIALYFATEPSALSRESGEIVIFRVPKIDIKYFLISPQAQPRPPPLLNAIGKTSISAGWRETFRLKVTSMNIPSNMPRNESEIGG